MKNVLSADIQYYSLFTIHYSLLYKSSGAVPLGELPRRQFIMPESFDPGGITIIQLRKRQR